MEERRFFITEVPPDSQGWRMTLTSVTESELKRRLALIAPMELTDDNGDPTVGDDEIDMLVHGEKVIDLKELIK